MARLSDSGLKAALKRPRNSQVEIPDGAVPGLMIRVGTGSSATWTLRVRVAGEGGVSPRGRKRMGRKHRVTLGTYPAVSLHAARAKASELIEQARGGSSPIAAMEKASVAADLSIQALSAKFLKDYVFSKQLDSAEKYKNAFDTHINPAIGKTLAELLSREDARTLMNKVREPRSRPAGQRGGHIGGVEAARTIVGVLRQMYSWAIEEEIVKRRDNPASNLQRGLPKKKRGERVLSLDEARMVWNAAESAGYAFGTHAQLMLLTACRSAEWAYARRAWIDLNEALVVIPSTSYKSDHVHVVPLVPQAVEILTRIPKGRIGDYLLSSAGGEKPIQGISKFFRTRLPAEILALYGNTLSTPFTSHDLRRTVATHLAESLGDQGDKLVKRVLGHSDGSVTAIYNRYAYVKEMRAALETWARDLTA